MPTVICPVCTEPFHHSPSHPQIYCGAKCWGLSQRKHAPKHCPECGKDVKRDPDGTRIFCSRTCKSANFARTRPQAICEGCGATYPAGKNKHYCSNACKHRHYAGERHHAHKEGTLDKNGYKRTRGGVYEHREVFARHLGRGLKRNELVHHISEDKARNELTNLLLISVGNHNILHALQEARGSILTASELVALGIPGANDHLLTEATAPPTA